jgi:plasmid stabilization system protein ParE
MGWQVAITDEADADLENVVAFLAKKSPEAAERIGLELVDLIFSLDQFPDQGAPVKSRPGLRKIAHRHYLVIYRVNEAQSLVEIVRVWDGCQDPRELVLPKRRVDFEVH